MIEVNNNSEALSATRSNRDESSSSKLSYYLINTSWNSRSFNDSMVDDSRHKIGPYCWQFSDNWNQSWALLRIVVALAPSYSIIVFPNCLVELVQLKPIASQPVLLQPTYDSLKRKLWGKCNSLKFESENTFCCTSQKSVLVKEPMVLGQVRESGDQHAVCSWLSLRWL